MMNRIKYFLICILAFCSCTNSNESPKPDHPANVENPAQVEEPIRQTEHYKEKESTQQYRSPHTHSSYSESDCGFHDGTYTADVSYSNPNTGFSNEYTLDVEVEDCQIVQIYFHNGGYLNGDHIDPTDLDNDGFASAEDDRGRTFDVQLDASDKVENNEEDDPPDNY